MELISIDSTNIDNEHICCAIGNDKQNTDRAKSKKEWMKERFREGLVFKRLNERGKVFIEYMPVESVWKPVIGINYMIINCLWVSGKFKGAGNASKLLNECINDAREKQKNGIAVVTSTKTKPFLTDKKFYSKHGFVSVDTALPYFELMVLSFNDKAELPRFTAEAKSGLCEHEKGVTIIYSNQCPFMEEYAKLYESIMYTNGVNHKIIKLTSSKMAQEFGSPFGTFGIYIDGKFETHELMPQKKFEEFLSSKLGIDMRFLL